MVISVPGGGAPFGLVEFFFYKMSFIAKGLEKFDLIWLSMNSRAFKAFSFYSHALYC